MHATFLALLAPMVAFPDEPMVLTPPPPIIIVSAQVLTNDIVVFGAETRLGYAINERIMSPDVDLAFVTEGLVRGRASPNSQSNADFAWQEAVKTTRPELRHR